MHPLRPSRVAIETTLLVHGVPRTEAPRLARELAADIRANGAEPVIVGLVRGRPTVGLTDPELAELLEARDIPKANSSNLGICIHQRQSAATTVSATMELAAGAGIQLFATGGLGGIHRGYATSLDISADLAALARFPVAVVCSGVKSILDVAATREALETLGIPVVGFQTDRFPEFYLRGSDTGLDARFDDLADLAAFIHAELARSGRGIVVANPIPEASEIDRGRFDAWLAEANARAGRRQGRSVTPDVLAVLHELSGGETLRANIALARSNAVLAARLAAGASR